MTEYIDKDALLSYLYNLQDEPHDIAIEIAHFPAVDVAPVRHGAWIPVDEMPPCGEWRCSDCGQSRIFTWDMSIEDMMECYLYCPNCGAKMDGEPDGRI